MSITFGAANAPATVVDTYPCTCANGIHTCICEGTGTFMCWCVQDSDTGIADEACEHCSGSGIRSCGSDDCGHGEICHHCNGSGEQELMGSEGEFNLSNDNALTLIRALGFAPDDCGSVPASDFPAARQAAIRLLNSRKLQEAGAVDSYVSNRPGCAKLISFGRSETYLAEKARLFLDLIIIAERSGSSEVYWC